MNSRLSLDADGAELFRGAATSVLYAVAQAFGDIAYNKPGLRLRQPELLRPLLVEGGCLRAIAEQALGKPALPVRTILFDKTHATNWSLGWHQDRTICVKRRAVVPGFTKWTVKGGMAHVEPPFEILSRMVTMRVHLDEVDDDNAPLLIAPQSHSLGRIIESDIPAVVEALGSVACLAAAGDVWLYSTPILHASDRAKSPCHRRVLQVDFSGDTLPAGLEWAEV